MHVPLRVSAAVARDSAADANTLGWHVVGQQALLHAHASVLRL